MSTKTWVSVFAVFTLLVSAGAAKAVVTDIPLRDNVGVQEVCGADRMNPRWKTDIGNDEFRRTLVRALDQTGLLERARGEGRFGLDAALESLEQPSAGFTATSRVRYTLTDRRSGKAVYQESISAEYAAKMWDSFMNPGIGRKICEGAARVNAAILAEQLLGLSLFQDEVSMSK